MNRIITIGREFGSGGRELGRRLSEEVFSGQREILRELAEKSDCIIIGRCADHILADREPVRLFVYADMKSKIKRCREKDPEENRTDAVLEREILKIDKGRAAYYSHFTGLEWGNREHYDLCINTTNCEIKNLAQRLSGMFY